MNLLSHYFLDKNHPSDYFKLGILLPDFVRGFNRKLRKLVFTHQSLESAYHLEILNGISRHYQLDAVFHQSVFFREYTAVIKTYLEQSLPSLNRKYFLAHLYLEMLLDRLLIKQFPDLPVQFYSNLKNLNLQTVSKYFVRIGAPDFRTDFFDIFTRFTEKQYLYHYLDNEKFINALLRVYQKIIPLTLSPVEISYLKELTTFLENQYHQELLEIFQVLDKKLARAEKKLLTA